MIQNMMDIDSLAASNNPPGETYDKIYIDNNFIIVYLNIKLNKATAKLADQTIEG